MKDNRLAGTNNNSNGRPASRKGRAWLALGVLAALAVIPIFTRPGPLRVRTTTVERGPIRSLISTNGKVEPIQNFEAHSPVPTTVKRLFIKEGDHVRKGQLLLQLDDADLLSQAARAQAQMKSAQANQSDLQNSGTKEELLTLDSELAKARNARDSAQRNLEALRRLQQQGAASAGEVKQAEDALQRAQADTTLLEQKRKDRYSQPEVARVQAQGAEAQAAYDAAEDALRKSSVRAPFDGIVYALPVKQGAYVQTGDLLLQEGDLSRMLVRTFVDEPDIGRLATGQKIEVTWDALPGRIWTGTVSTIPSTVKLRGARNVGEVTCTLRAYASARSRPHGRHKTICLSGCRRQTETPRSRSLAPEPDPGRNHLGPSRTFRRGPVLGRFQALNRRRPRQSGALADAVDCGSGAAGLSS